MMRSDFRESDRIFIWEILEMNSVNRVFATFFVSVLLTLSVGTVNAADPLPSWNDGASKSAIIEFVGKITRDNSPGYLPEPERIAVFDNDGTLWSEQPAYFQLLFAMDRVKALAPKHPEWKSTQPFQAVLEGDMKTLAASGEKGLLTLIMATHAGMTSVEFRKIVDDWLVTARHPKFKRPYTDLVYQPMLELLSYLRANGFKTFIVSGGGIEFMRAFAEGVYGVPPEQVIGSSIKTKFQLNNGIPEIVREADINFIDDKDGKPVGINQFIGRRPVAAFGNSDGDLQMLQYTTIPRSKEDTTPRFGLIVHHTDAEREFAYDRKSTFGHLDKALDEASKNGWVVVDMKKDWKKIYPAD
jgi:haloacid dehalogenase-like hydrolase